MAGEQILIVDDNATNLKLVAYLMKANGYDVDQMGLFSEAATMVDDVASDEEGWLCLYKVSIPASL